MRLSTPAQPCLRSSGRAIGELRPVAVVEGEHDRLRRAACRRRTRPPRPVRASPPGSRARRASPSGGGSRAGSRTAPGRARRPGRAEHVVLEDRHRAGVRLPVRLRGGVADRARLRSQRRAAALRPVPAGRGRRFTASGSRCCRAPESPPASDGDAATTRDHDRRRGPAAISRRRRRRLARSPPLRLAAGEQLLAVAASGPSGPLCLGWPSAQAIMVGKGPMQSAGKPIENLAEALRSAYPELEAIRDASRRARLPGRRRRPRPAARPRPRRPRPRRRGRRRALWPRGSGAEPRRARALRHRQGRARRPRDRHRQRPLGDLPAAGRAARGQPRRRRSRPTWAAATSRSTRWRSRCAGSRA